MGIPVFLGGMARGLLGKSSELQLRHCRREALKEADLTILAGGYHFSKIVFVVLLYHYVHYLPGTPIPRFSCSLFNLETQVPFAISAYLMAEFCRRSPRLFQLTEITVN